MLKLEPNHFYTTDNGWIFKCLSPAAGRWQEGMFAMQSLSTGGIIYCNPDGANPGVSELNMVREWQAVATEQAVSAGAVERAAGRGRA